MLVLQRRHKQLHGAMLALAEGDAQHQPQQHAEGAQDDHRGAEFRGAGCVDGVSPDVAGGPGMQGPRGGGIDRGGEFGVEVWGGGKGGVSGRGGDVGVVVADHAHGLAEAVDHQVGEVGPFEGIIIDAVEPGGVEDGGEGLGDGALGVDNVGGAGAVGVRGEGGEEPGGGDGEAVGFGGEALHADQLDEVVGGEGVEGVGGEGEARVCVAVEAGIRLIGVIFIGSVGEGEGEEEELVLGIFIGGGESEKGVPVAFGGCLV